MKPGIFAWAPAVALMLGAVGTVGIDAQRALDLRRPLDAAIPVRVLGQAGQDQPISEAEIRVLGVDAYILRSYAGNPSEAAAASPFSVYVGYYRSQMSGRTIHSPKNCLPGSGWEALSSMPATIDTPAGAVIVNRYLLQNGNQRALALYWYQGRGRVEANEYVVKWDLLRDAALRRRSDEAIVRILVPVGDDEAAAFATASRVATEMIGAVDTALPL